MRRCSLASLPLLLSDLLALALSLAVARSVAATGATPLRIDLLFLFALLGSGLVLAKAALRLYPGLGIHGVVELERSVIAAVIVFGAFVLSDFLNGPDWGLKPLLLITGVLYIVAAPTLRAVARWIVRGAAWWRQPLLVFGPEPGARRVSEYFSENPGLGFNPVRVEWDQAPSGNGISYGRVAQDPHLVLRMAERHGATCAAVPLGPSEAADQDFFLEQCANVFPHLLIVPEPRSLPDFWTTSADIGGAIGVRVGRSLLNPVMRGAKRVMDLSLIIPIALLATPFFLLIALAVKLTSPGPIIYGSERIGKDRRSFQAWKFRTMHVNSDEVLQNRLERDAELREEWERTNKVRRDPRITSVGRWLRRSSLDELPQLWNVLRGDMSLVGPRPVLPEEVGRRGRDFGLYLSVLPGLTGLWQISGRSETTYEERRRLDSYYVRNWSVWLDVYILVRTARAVLSGHGAY